MGVKYDQNFEQDVCACVCVEVVLQTVCVYFFLYFYSPIVFTSHVCGVGTSGLQRYAFRYVKKGGIARVLPESGLGSGSGWIKLHFDDFVGVKRVKFFPMAPAKYASLDVEGTHLTTRLSV